MTAVLILALGIGANTAMFSVVRAVLLRPLDYSQPDRIVRVATLWKKSGHQGQVSAPDFHDWHDQSSAFEHMAIYANYEMPVSVGSGANATAEFPMATAIASDFFECFGVTPVVGREFTPDEMKVGSAGAAIISYGFAVRNFGEPQLALGKALVAEGKPLDIVGVMPPGFRFPGEDASVDYRRHIRRRDAVAFGAQLSRRRQVEGRRRTGASADTDDGDRQRGWKKNIRTPTRRRASRSRGFAIFW